MKTIILTHAAARDLDKLPSDARSAMIEALTSFAVEGKADVLKLAGRDGYRLRVGDYRALFTQDETTIVVVYIGRRSTTTYRRN